MNNNELLPIFKIIFAFTFVILTVFIIILIILLVKERFEKKDNKIKKRFESKTNEKKDEVKEYNKQSIFNFMEFDNIYDNMIMQKNGKKFLMVIECQGVNFDLMSGMEKNTVEQGFIQFLNTLRYPIQIYVQTRTVNLEKSIETYKNRIDNITKKYRELQSEYKRKINSEDYTEEQLNKEKYNLARQKNLYEYGVDIVSNTERLSLNKNILSKHYYIIISHYADDNPDIHYAKEEIANIAFSELYTKAQTIINSLAVCGVLGKVLDSVELTELLYIAYNRDESEIFDLKRALNSGYEDLYSTAPDVYEKRIKEIRKKVQEEAERQASEIINEAIEESEKQKQARIEEENLNKSISNFVQELIKNNEKRLGKDITEKALEIEKIKNEESKETDLKRKTNRKKGGSKNVEKKEADNN